MRGDAGAVTVEAAIAIAALTIVVALGVGCVFTTTMYIRCVDAARETARLAARGATVEAAAAGQRVAPSGARITLQEKGTHIVATVSVEVPLLPALDLTATAHAAKEPDGSDQW